MSLVRLNKALKNISENKKLARFACTNASIKIEEGIVELITDGVPSTIVITYSGAANFSSLMPLFFKVKVGRKRIIINNFFKKAIPEKLVAFSGNITIKKCLIISSDSSKINATIENNQNLHLINKSNTNLEDDSMIIFEEPQDSKLNLPTVGLSKIKPSRLYSNELGKIQKYGKLEAENIASILTQYTQSIPKGKLPKSAKTLKYQDAKSIISKNINISPNIVKPKLEKRIKTPDAVLKTSVERKELKSDIKKGGRY